MIAPAALGLEGQSESPTAHRFIVLVVRVKGLHRASGRIMCEGRREEERNLATAVAMACWKPSSYAQGPRI